MQRERAALQELPQRSGDNGSHPSQRAGGPKVCSVLGQAHQHAVDTSPTLQSWPVPDFANWHTVNNLNVIHLCSAYLHDC